jgi:7-cyano-7-deazaguanine synthase in queuosine biosynthesis
MKLVCKLSEDDFQLEGSRSIDLNCKTEFKYTFWKQNNIYTEFYKDEAIDMLYLSLAVFAADRLILRESGEDAWSREIELYMPVLCVDKWVECQSLVEGMLNFLTGDSWKICFRIRELTEIEKKARKRWERVTDKNMNISKICMFSGGLDSCIGALDLLCDNTDVSDIVFVRHSGGGQGTKEYQEMLKEAFIKQFNLDESYFIQNYAAVITKKEVKEEDTTRSRSFMFFSHAVAYASAMGKEIDLIIPENGLISLNIPLAYTRTGTSSTRTTHPHYMKMLQELIAKLGIQVKIRNPFQFKTKGEMILECKNRKFLQEILEKTMSCSHPDVRRHHGMKKTMHCGYCLPCTIRRAAIQKGRLKDTSTYFDKMYKALPVARQAYRTYTCAFNGFNENIAFLRIQESGPIEENIEQFADLYVRGMKEMRESLEKINV